ncbi:MAG: vanadium-dependent haloperoxidase [Pseudomonadota bacterium]|nr:vanadium-dependent haloperoxidase [Pseudomonadota bacterium]
MPKMHLKAAAGAFVALMAAAQPAAADTVSDWWEFANKISPLYAPGTPDQKRAVTRASLAMFEALNAIDRRYGSYLNLPAGDPAASQDAAAATAVYKVLLHHYPDKKATLDDSYAIAMAEIRDDRARKAGRVIGEQAAQAAMTAGGLDPTVKQTPYRPRTIPGVWIGASPPSIEAYTWAYKPWAIPSVEALRAPPPPALTSATWARDYEEVRRLGGKTSTERTPHQTLMARYREGPDLTPSLRALADSPGRRPVQNARMFALYQMAFDDAVMVMAESKNHYNFWRPITAIRNGDEDGNEATERDPAWTPLLTTPNFSEYPCGHCTFAAAVAEVMKAETGPAPKGGVRVASMSMPNSLVQVLPSWDEWVRQVSASRTYGGVHYRFANEAGEEIGRRAARIVLERVARPLPTRRAAR